MLADPEWADLLFERYQEHCALSARRNEEPQPFDQWAIEATWTDFVRLARLVLALPEFSLNDWATENPVPSVNSHAQYRSRILARSARAC